MHQGQVKRGTFRVGQRWTRSQMILISASLALGVGTETTGGAEATGPPPCCLRQRPVCRRSLSSPRKHKGTTLCGPTSSGSRDPTPVAALCVGDRPLGFTRHSFKVGKSQPKQPAGSDPDDIIDAMAYTSDGRPSFRDLPDVGTDRDSRQWGEALPHLSARHHDTQSCVPASYTH